MSKIWQNGDVKYVGDCFNYFGDTKGCGCGQTAN